MIDIHCHVLPYVDDGAKDLENSIDMIKIAQEDGIKKIIATPHFYTGHYETEYSKIKENVESLNKEIKNRGINVEIFPGQEVFLDRYTVENYKNGLIGCLNNSKYMLVETDMFNFKEDTMDIIYELKLLGVKPIIAHPERYAYVNKDLNILNKFIDEECLFQINASSLGGLFGKKVKKTAELLIKNNLCNFIATDAHSCGKRSPKMKGIYENLREIKPKQIMNLDNNSEKITQNGEIFYNNSNIKEKKNFFVKIFSK